MNRSSCVLCKKKRIRSKMVQHGQHWTCQACVTRSLPGQALRSAELRVLNLYAGVGGNRLLWPEGLSVTAVELHPMVAAEYRLNFPRDRVVIGDAHSYLLKHFKEYDIIWTSRPCLTHTRMNYVLTDKRYVDMGLYQEVLLLKSFFKGRFVSENVVPYYIDHTPLLAPDYILHRHSFWTNVVLSPVDLPALPKQYSGHDLGINVMPKQALCEWLGMPAGEKNIYMSGKSKEQVYRNCVHPLLGKSIMADVLRSMAGK